jgi:hypothetical protein
VSATRRSSKYNSKKHKNNKRYNTDNDATVVTGPHVSMNGA